MALQTFNSGTSASASASASERWTSGSVWSGCRRLGFVACGAEVALGSPEELTELKVKATSTGEKAFGGERFKRFLYDSVEYPQENKMSSDDADQIRNDALRSHHAGNVMLLAVVFVLFGGFALAEIFAAIASSSLSLLGDAASMVVDASTYGLNMIAERRKGLGISEMTRVKLELFIPLASMLALFATSVYVMNEAMDTIRNPPEHGETGDTIMLIFASVNLAIDVVSVFCFARVNRLLGYAVKDAVEGITEDEYDAEFGHGNQNSARVGHGDVDDGDAGLITNGVPASETTATQTNTFEQHLLHTRDIEADLHSKSNTNMCSAYTHVIADTLRSIAVMAAAILSLADDDVNSNIADAWAAIAVSVIIFGSLYPLSKGLMQKYRQLRYLRQKQQIEQQQQ